MAEFGKPIATRSPTRNARSRFCRVVIRHGSAPGDLRADSAHGLRSNEADTARKGGFPQQVGPSCWFQDGLSLGIDQVRGGRRVSPPSWVRLY